MEIEMVASATHLTCYDCKTYKGTLDQRWAHVRSLGLDTRTGWRRKGRKVKADAQPVARIHTRVTYGGDTQPYLYSIGDTSPKLTIQVVWGNQWGVSQFRHRTYLGAVKEIDAERSFDRRTISEQGWGAYVMVRWGDQDIQVEGNHAMLWSDQYADKTLVNALVDAGISPVDLGEPE